MIVNMSGSATEEQIEHVVARIKEFGYQAHLIRGEERTVIGIVGKSDRHRSELEALRSSPGVEELVAISHPFKTSRRATSAPRARFSTSEKVCHRRRQETWL